MGEIDDQILARAAHFEATGDWPQPFDAFVPPGADDATTQEAIRRLQHAGRLAVGHFEAGPESADVVLGLGHV